MAATVTGIAATVTGTARTGMAAIVTSMQPEHQAERG